MTHTPGPWSIQHFNDEPTACICAGEGDIRVLTLEANCSDAEHDANARLIASVPEAMQELEALAEYVELALQELTDQDTGWYYQLKQHAQQARKIIAKAKGQS